MPARDVIQTLAARHSATAALAVLLWRFWPVTGW